MTAVKRPDTGKWYVRINDWRNAKGRKQKPLRLISPVQTKRGAEAYERTIRDAIARGTYGKERNQRTFKEFSTEFLNIYAKNNNKNSAQKAKRGVMKNHLVPFFGAKTLDEITTKDVETYKAKKLDQPLLKKRKGKDGKIDTKATYSKKAINNHLGILSKALNVAVDWGYIPYRIKIPMFRKVPLPDVDFLSFQEYERLRAQVTGQHGRVILLAANTGLRVGEMRALTWDDVDLVAKKLYVKRSISHGVTDTPKSGKHRELPLNDSALAVLKEQKHLRGDLVFSNPDGKTHLEINTMYRRLEFFCQKAGLRRIGFHTLRHTFASHLVMRAVPLKAVQEFLGHATIDMTLRYSHLSPDVKRDYVLLLDRKQPAGSPQELEDSLKVAPTGPALALTS